MTIQGAVGDPTVTNAVVPVGTYDAGRVGWPGRLHRVGVVLHRSDATDPAAATVTLAAGDAATCTITNTDQPATLTLVKVVDGAASGSGQGARPTGR